MFEFGHLKELVHNAVANAGTNPWDAVQDTLSVLTIHLLCARPCRSVARHRSVPELTPPGATVQEPKRPLKQCCRVRRQAMKSAREVSRSKALNTSGERLFARSAADVDQSAGEYCVWVTKNFQGLDTSGR